MNPEDIKALIDQLLKTGEILATEVYRISMQQVGVEIVGYSAFALALIIIGALFMWIYAREDEDVTWMIISWAFWIVSLLPIYGVLARVINPEWYAIKLALELVGIR